MANEHIDKVVGCWEASGVSTLNQGATQQQRQDAERLLGRSFPDEFVALYEHCTGGDVLEGNIQLDTLDGADLSVVQASDFRVSGPGVRTGARV